jgi:hypothetical protein
MGVSRWARPLLEPTGERGADLPRSLEGFPMRLEFESLEDRILWHVVRELTDARDGVSIPYLVQTLSDLGPVAVARVIEQLQRDEIVAPTDEVHRDGAS